MVVGVPLTSARLWLIRQRLRSCSGWRGRKIRWAILAIGGFGQLLWEAGLTFCHVCLTLQRQLAFSKWGKLS